MTAKIVKFGPRTKPAPMTKSERDALVDALLDLASDVEAGKVQDFYGAIVYDDDKTGAIGILPRKPTRMVVSLDRAKHDLLRAIENGGFN